MSPILTTSQCEFNGARSCAHARKTIPIALIHPFTKQMVPSLCPELLTQSLSKSFSPAFHMHPIKCFLPSITFLCVHRFFLIVSLSFFYFHHTLSCGLAGAYVNHRSFFKLSFCAFISLSNNALISQQISAKLVSALPPCMLYLSY